MAEHAASVARIVVAIFICLSPLVLYYTNHPHSWYNHSVSPNGRIIDLVGTLEFFDFVMPVEHVPPSSEELESIANNMGVHFAAAVVEDYLSVSSDRYAACGIRAGCVLRLRDGGYLLVGHISERLGYIDDAPFLDLHEIEAIAYLY
jgi:hypothetical protein